MLNFFKKLFGFADVNKDGKVDRSDAKVAATAVAATAKTTAAKVKTTTKAKVARVKKAVTK